jgi:DnaK suppressor protein
MAQKHPPAPAAKSGKTPSKTLKAAPKADPKSSAKLAAAKPVDKNVKHDKKVEEKKPATKIEAKADPKSSMKIAVAPEKTEKKANREEPLTMPRIAPAAKAAEPVEAEKPAVTSNMSKKQMERFRTLLEEKRNDILKKAKETLEEDMTLDTNDLPDEMDLASSEYLQSFTFRLRGREKTFLDKIGKAIERIDEGSFGVCEECGDDISVKRLEARPETTLCIRCKEDQERAEKDFG